MEIDVKQRIKEIIKQKETTVNQLSACMNVSQSTLTRQINGDTVLSVSTVLSICEYFKDVSIEWLMTGEGEKYKQNIQNKAGESCKNTVKIVVELEISKGEFDDMGLKDKVIQILNK